MRKPEEIRDAIERLSSLPTIPPVVSKILRVIDADDVSIEKIGEFISSDQALSARVLKIVNSPVYGFPGRISSISQAIMLLGLSALKGMLLGVSIIDIMEKTMLGLWEHSFGTAMAARLIASKRGYKDIEDASVAGLIHDIGKVALSLCYPKEYGQVVSEAEEKGDYITVHEKEVLGITHDTAGLWIATKWHFPSQLVEAIGYHHRPSRAPGYMLLTSIIHLADSVVKMMGVGYSGDPLVHPVDKQAWQLIGFDRKEMLELFRDMERGLAEYEGPIF